MPTAALLLLVSIAPSAGGDERFPRPELPKGYVYPETYHTAARAAAFEWADVAVLAGSLVLAAWLVHKRRSRRAVFLLMVFALLYFGFYRRGCVCPIGATQHVAGAVTGACAVPVPWLLFFALPLAFALFFGRVFCSSVCPLGAVQDIVLVRPLKVPLWLEHALGLFAYVYLGLAVLLAVTGAGYVICTYDPFVPFFRLAGPVAMFAVGILFLVMALFLGRPYCRFLCPYGALLRLCSMVSWKRVRTTPDECIRCRLCEDACPFGAIRKPTAVAKGAARTAGKTTLALLLVAVPVIVGVGGWAGRLTTGSLAAAHPTVLRAGEVRQSEQGDPTAPGFRTEAFLKTGRTPEQLYEEEDGIRRQFRVGGTILGAWVGLVIAVKLIALSVRRARVDYEPDRGACVACARCFAYCPREHLRLKRLRGESATPGDAKPAEDAGTT